MTSEDARQALGRVAASETFSDAENARRLLLYLGEASLDGRADQLKEYTVGVEVLGRPAHYEPRFDSSARMLAGRLRRKLEDHYRGAGASDGVRISFPKGGFKLTFAPASHTPSGTAAEIAKWRRIALVCAAAFLVTAAWLVMEHVRSGDSGTPADRMSPEVKALWQPILDGGAPVLVSFGSPLFVTANEWMMRTSSLNDWSQVATFPPLQRLMRALGAKTVHPMYDYAGIGDVNGAFLIGKLLGGQVPQLELKRGTVLSWEDIQNNNLIFIGNGKNQEKLRYLLEHLEFSMDGSAIHCHAPRPGEPAEYRRGPDTSDYGLISLLPGSRKGRYMMLLSAIDTSAIWGVAEAVTNPRFAEPLVRHIRGNGSLPKSFQAVIRIRVNAGVPVAMDYVVHHELADRVPLQ